MDQATAMKDDAGCIAVVAVACLAGGIMILLRNDDLAAGRAARLTPEVVTTSKTAASDPISPPADDAPHVAPSGLFLTDDGSGPVVRAGAHASWPSYQSKSPTVVGVLADLEEPWRPTPEGLLLRTSDLWAQEDFLNLSPDRMRSLLPLDDDLALLPESMDLRALIGSDLPTLDDCRVGLQDSHTKALLEKLIVVEATYSELCETPAGERTRDRKAIIQRLAAERDAAEEALMQRLDQATTYRHWALLSKLYLEWQR